VLWLSGKASRSLSWGLLVGIFGAFALAKAISGFLFGVSAWDPIVFVTVPVVLLATAVLAVWWPAGPGYGSRSRGGSPPKLSLRFSVQAKQRQDTRQPVRPVPA
jgi:hypothetical protein